MAVHHWEVRAAVDEVALTIAHAGPSRPGGRVEFTKTTVTMEPAEARKLARKLLAMAKEVA